MSWEAACGAWNILDGLDGNIGIKVGLGGNMIALRGQLVGLEGHLVGLGG